MGLNMTELEVVQNYKVVDDIFKIPTHQERKHLEFASSRYDFLKSASLLVSCFEPIPNLDDFLIS